MDNPWNVKVDIPDDLDEVIRRGLSSGRAAADRRRRYKRMAGRSVCSLVVLLGLFVGGIHASPTFAAAVREIPVLGELVRVFETNQPFVQGGSQAEEGSAVLTMERSGDAERICLTFDQAQAGLYQVEFASYPKTVTITLPGTKEVAILSQISRAADTSAYIKSVYSLPTSTQQMSAIQLELESDADVRIEEYQAPGGMVVELSPTQNSLDTVYSVRTLSMDEQSVREAAGEYDGQFTRILRDESGLYFLEFSQYGTQEEAGQACGKLLGETIVEMRTGNNVPASFATMQEYQSSCFLNRYYQVLLTSTGVEPVLDFLEQNFAQASREEQDVLLLGLSGFLQDYEEETDWQRVASFYQLAGQALPDFVDSKLSVTAKGES